MKIFTHTFPLGVLCLGLASCANYGSGQLQLTNDGVPYSYEFAGAAHVSVESIHTARQGDLLVAIVTVKAKTLVALGSQQKASSSNQTRFNFSWFDSDGRPLNSPANVPQDRAIFPGTTATISQVAPSPKAASFRVLISRP